MHEMGRVKVIFCLVFGLIQVWAIDQHTFEPVTIPFCGVLNGREFKMRLIGQDLLLVEGSIVGEGRNALSAKEETFLNTIRHRKPFDEVGMELKVFGLRKKFEIQEISIEKQICTSQIKDSYLSRLSGLGCDWKIPLTVCFNCKEQQVCYSGYIYRECST
jgi:hypothetical protein